MSIENLDNRIEECLAACTEHHTELKEDTWRNIEMNINNKNYKAYDKKRKSYKTWIAVAATLIIVVLANTTYGKAAVKYVKSLLVPEKEIEEQIEGLDEKHNVQLEESSVGYSIYFDKERYELKTDGDRDLILPILPPDADIPDVYMEILQVEDETPEKAAIRIYDAIKGDFDTIKEVEDVSEPISSKLLEAWDNTASWDSSYVRYYFVDNTKEGTFIIKQVMFTEAIEGHGTRFDNMLKEFSIRELAE